MFPALATQGFLKHAHAHTLTYTKKHNNKFYSAHFNILCVQYIEYGQQSRDPPVKMQGSITTPGSLALAHVQAQAQSQQPGGPKAPQPGQPSTLVTTTTTTTTATKTTTITRPTPSNFKKDVPVSLAKLLCLLC